MTAAIDKMISDAAYPAPEASAGNAEHVDGHVFWPGDDRHAPDLERERNIALLKTIRAQLVDTIEAAQRYDMRLAGEFDHVRAEVDQRLAGLLLRRELDR